MQVGATSDPVWYQVTPRATIDRMADETDKVVSIPYRTSRARADELKRRAAAAGFSSVQAYMDRKLELDPDMARQRTRAAVLSGYARTYGDPEFDALDAELAARPRSTPAELGFDPGVQTQGAA
jgi:hypothetical protein